jgi:hypothetical protein
MSFTHGIGRLYSHHKGRSTDIIPIPCRIFRSDAKLIHLLTGGPDTHIGLHGGPKFTCLSISVLIRSAICVEVSLSWSFKAFSQRTKVVPIKDDVCFPSAPIRPLATVLAVPHLYSHTLWAHIKSSLRL